MTCLELAVLALVHGLVGAGMADGAVPLDDGGVGLDDFERVCAGGSGHGAEDTGVVRRRSGEGVDGASWSDGMSVSVS
jgi:hypothetical protein